MRPGRFFWGSFLVGLGVFMMLQRLSVFAMDWPILWRLWPLVLVFWGAGVLLRGSRVAPIAVSLAGLTLAGIVAAFAEWGFDWEGTAADHAAGDREFTQSFDAGLRRASFHLDSGTGSYTVEGTTDHLVGATVRSESGRYIMRGERIEQSEDVSLRLEGERKAWAFSRSGNRVLLRFNARVPWDMRFSVGASRLDLDLSPLLVERVSVEAGASRVRVRLGDRAEETRLSIASGVSAVRILVPRASACEISSDSPLSRKSFKEFSRTVEGTYRTENFASAEKKVFISLESGISSLTVVRY